MPKGNEKQNPKESYTKKYQAHIACSYGYKLVYADDKFSKPFMTYLDEHIIYKFFNNRIKESKCCSDVIKKHFNKEFVMSKKDTGNFKNFSKCCICDNNYINKMLK